MMELREYQKDIAGNAAQILRQLNIIYLAMEVRTGKTATALETARLFGATNVLFTTKKKAISSIEKDYLNFGFNNHFNLTALNRQKCFLGAQYLEPDDDDL